jgi:hypothetical protein
MITTVIHTIPVFGSILPPLTYYACDPQYHGMIWVIVLVDKMRWILGHDQLDTSAPRGGRSLNNHQRRQQLTDIVIDNEKILKRIIARPPAYNRTHWQLQEAQRIKLLHVFYLHPSPPLLLLPSRTRLRRPMSSISPFGGWICTDGGEISLCGATRNTISEYNIISNSRSFIIVIINSSATGE